MLKLIKRGNFGNIDECILVGKQEKKVHLEAGEIYSCLDIIM